LEDDGFWRLIIGSKLDNPDGTKDGMSLMYKSSDFINWELQDSYLHEVPGTGMWECVDFFPVTTDPKNQLDNTEGLKGQNEFGLEHHAALKAENYVDSYRYVLKASLDTWLEDHYTIGTYSTLTHKFTVDDPALDIGKGYRYDYGKFYASKTFYDSSTGRRIVWSWVSESDTEQDDIIKGWASLQAIPRTIWLDGMTQKNLLTWPVQEVEALRGARVNYQNIVLNDGDVIKVDGGDGSQLDVIISFEKPDVYAVGNVNPEEFDCAQGGSAQKGIFGPFGVLVHTDHSLTEQTAVFFYITPTADGQWSTRVCSDQSRSSLAQGLDKAVYGSSVTVLPIENEISLRILLDHSIVETFAMGGRMAITSRVYPTKALNEDSHLFIFNNGTTPVKITNLDVYQMTDVHMIPI
jgi:beta-fructofuranosidase